MDLNTFITAVFCLTDDWLQQQASPRSRGPAPELSDSEVLTIEIVGEFLGIDAEKGLYTYFSRRHYGEWFPALKRVHRTTFTRQMANLWVVKRKLWRELLSRIGFDPEVSLIDSFPLPVCRFARAYRCRLLAQESAFGYDEMSKQTVYGLRVHLHVAWPGVIVGVGLAPADAHDLHLAEELLEEAKGWALGDRNYWSPELARRLEDEGLRLLAPYKSKKREEVPWPRWLTQKRRRIETVISQLVERYGAKKVWARDRWHLTSRWLRKILSHT
ncbi:MAG: IS982 family transposase [Actinomycetota bacterium]|nr:IS982 family transposase [Actinomycetota bacterium]